MNIHQMAFNGDLEGIKRTIKSSPDQVNQFYEINVDDEVHRITPIFLAAIAGNIEITKLLLNNHATTDCSGESDRLDDWVDLSRAKNRHRLRKILYRNKFKDLNCLDVDFIEFQSIRRKINAIIKQSIDSSLEWGQSDFEFYTLMGERGSLERIQELVATERLESIWIEAIYIGALSSCRYDVLEFLEVHIDFSNILKSDLYDISRLILNAIVNGNVQALERFHIAGVDLAKPIKGNGADGITLAFIAVLEKRTEVLQFLHEINIDLSEAVTKGPLMGFTPVYKAVELGYVDILELLHKLGVNVEAPAKVDGVLIKHPSIYAIIKHQMAVLEFYHKIGVNFDDLSAKLNLPKLSIVAALNNNVPALEFLHRIGMDLSASSISEGGDGLIPIGVAAVRGYKDVVQYLFSIGVDLSKQMLIGNDLDLTPACQATEYGHVHLLEYFHQCGVNLSEPVHEGADAGKTPAFIAALRGHVSILKFLKTLGIDLAAPIKKGEFEGCTLASIAARQGKVEILQYLHLEGINILEELSSGAFKGFNPLFIAALYENINVLEFFNSHGIFSEIFPSKLKKEHHIIAKRSYNKITPLLNEQSVALLCRKIVEDHKWFRTYPKIFFHYMDHIPTKVWAVSANVNQIKKIYNTYIELKGANRGWLVNLLIECINLSKRDFDIEALLANMGSVSIDDLKGAVCPGNNLLQLFKWVSMRSAVLNASNLTQLEFWMNGILKQTYHDELYWAEAKSYCEKIYHEVKMKVANHPSKGSVKGKKKPAQDPYKIWADKFDQKMLSVLVPQEELEKLIQSKIQISKDAFEKLASELKMLNDTFIKKADLTLAENTGGEQVFEIFKSQISNQFEMLIVRLTQLAQNCSRQMSETKEIKRISDLSEKLERIHLEKMKKAGDLKTEVLSQVSSLEVQFQKSLEDIKRNREFQNLKTSVTSKLNNYTLRAAEKGKNALETRLIKHLEEHQNRVAQATTTEELRRIKDKFKKDLNDATKVGMDLQQTEELSRLKQLLVDAKDRSKMMIKENNDLRKQLDAFERLSSVRSDSPEKIIPINEKPTRQTLIEKLTPFASFSHECKTALKMIQGEGKFLTSIEDLVRFLGLFKIELENISGSHAKYSDGKFTVILASHISESTPAQVEDVLSVVLSKLS